MLPETPPLPPPAPSPIERLLSAEQVRVAPGTDMGLVGLSYLREISPGWSLGPAVYAPLSGDRGGFFGWGLATQFRHELGPWGLEAGLFAGGGGGSPVWVGGGLMLRPHLTLSRQLGPLRLGLGVSQVWFPNGSVRSNQPFASLAWRGDALFGAPGGHAAAAGGAWAGRAWPSETSLVIGHYALRDPAVRRDGSGSGRALQVAGIAYRRDLPGDWAGLRPYWLLAAAGSLTSVYPGYAELMAGLGLRYPLPGYPAFGLRAEAALGSGGGGFALYTAGGLMRKLNLGASWQLGPNLSLAALTGRTGSNGRFEARETRFELAWLGWDVVPGAARAPGRPEAPLTWRGWSAAAGLAQFVAMRRDNGLDPGLAVASLKLERVLDPHWRGVLQATIATHGDAGGYATGQLGLAWLSARRPDSRWRYGAELSLGAAGGGGVRTGGGLIAQAQWIGRYELSPNLALQVDAGWLRSPGGVLSTPVLALHTVYSFSRLQAP